MHFGRSLFRPFVWNSKRLSIPLVFAGLVCGFLGGCFSSPSAGNRVPLTGKVLKGGEPVQGNATIVLDPEDMASIGTMGEVRDGNFTIPAEMGPTPGKKYKVIVTTAPGIPAEGTPKDQIKLPQKLTGTVEIPEKGLQDLKIEVK